MEKKAVALEMMKFLDASKTPYHAVKISVEKLKEAGFKRLNLNKLQNLHLYINQNLK